MLDGVEADKFPGRRRESTSTTSPTGETGIRTRMPSSLINRAVADRHTSVTAWPAPSSLTASNEPYEAPNTRILRFEPIVSPSRIPTHLVGDLRPDGSRRKVRYFSPRGKNCLSRWRGSAEMTAAKDSSYACA